MTFEIEGLMNDEDIKWKKIPCTCNHDSVQTEYPIAKCIHCQCQAQEDMLPRESFDITISVEKEDGTLETQTKHINKVKINRGKKYDDIKGWFNIG